MSQSPFDEQSSTVTPWSHVWPYNQHEAAVLAGLEHAHSITTNGNERETGSLSPSSDTHLPKTILTMMDRHDCQSMLSVNMLATRPTFSQIFIMAHTSANDEVDPTTTRHRLPKRKFIGHDDCKGQIPGPPFLLPQRRKFFTQIPVIREDSMESPPCSSTVDAKHRDLDGSMSPRGCQCPTESPNVQAGKISHSVGDGQVKPDGQMALPARKDSAVTKAQKTCILRLCRAWMTFGAPLSIIAIRLRFLAQVFGVSLVVIGTPSAIMCVFRGLDDTKRPEIYYVQCDRRLSLRKLRQVDVISEQLVDCATHSLGTTMHLRIENTIGQLDKVLLEERKHKSTALTRVFKRLILSVYSFGFRPGEAKAYIEPRRGKIT